MRIAGTPAYTTTKLLELVCRTTTWSILIKDVDFDYLKNLVESTDAEGEDLILNAKGVTMFKDLAGPVHCRPGTRTR